MTGKPNREGKFREEDLNFLMGPDGHRVHVLPQETFGRLLPRPQFEPWRKPSPALPIDDVVADLMARDRAPRLVGSLAEGTPCPFWHARGGVVHAAGSADWAYAARDMFRQIQKSADEIGYDLDAGIEALKKLIEHFERRTDAGRGLDIRGGVQPRAARANAEVAERRSRCLTEAIPVLKQALDALGAAGSCIAERVGEIDVDTPQHLQWRAAFIESLGGTWFELTGAWPSTGARSPFVAFVSAAFLSIGGNDAVPWEHAVRTVVEHVGGRPPWDQFDRYAERRLPPGVRQETPAVRAEIGREVATSTFHWLATNARAVRQEGDSALRAEIEQWLSNCYTWEHEILSRYWDQALGENFDFTQDDVRNLAALRRASYTMGWLADKAEEVQMGARHLEEVAQDWIKGQSPAERPILDRFWKRAAGGDFTLRAEEVRALADASAEAEKKS